MPFKSCSISIECTFKPSSVQKDHAFIEEAQMLLEVFDVEVQNVAGSVTEFCGTTDYVDLISSSLKYLCGVIGLILDLRQATKCSTWMPLYYNTRKYIRDFALYNLVINIAIDELLNILFFLFVELLSFHFPF